MSVLFGTDLLTYVTMHDVSRLSPTVQKRKPECPEHCHLVLVTSFGGDDDVSPPFNSIK